MTSQERTAMPDMVKLEETGKEISSVCDQEQDKCSSMVQQERVLELIRRFGLRRSEDIATAMRISAKEARMLCKIHQDEEKNEE